MYQTLIKPFLADAKKFILDTLFPIHCLRCDREGSFICDVCLPELTRLKDQYCIVCGKPSPMGFTHPGCLTPHCADGLVSILNYHDEAVANILIKGKYNFLPDVYKILGLMIAKILASDYQHLLKPNTQNLTPVLVPIPLSPWRQRWRGFNQAEILCETIGKKLNLPVMDMLVRSKNTKVQKDVKKREDRIKNVRDAFTLDPNLKSKILNQQFLIIDDVTTTGSTLLEAAKVLKRNGAKSVWCLTVARD